MRVGSCDRRTCSPPSPASCAAVRSRTAATRIRTGAGRRRQRRAVGRQAAARPTPAHKTRGGVAIASGSVGTGGAGPLRYGAAKAAVVQPTRTPAGDAGAHGFRVTTVAPGWTLSP
ncbi:SDR family oxidoreductase [Streptomyces sp. NPDC017638]|uniref:SDR family oxidoreductase n=1 Tax=Streptomyces sp. NPDC017638 TaxID=3365004 RepID=UPI0037B9ACE5